MMESQAKYGKMTQAQPKKQTTLEMFYKKRVSDDAKDQESDARNTENNDVKSLTNESNNNDHLVTGQLESSGETDQAQACILDTGQTETKFVLHHKTGDLFSSPETDSLAHCVSKDLAMGKGIAVIFKKTFGGVEELKAQKKEVGDVAVLKRGHRFIYYLITKKKYWAKPTYDTLKDSLLSLKRHMHENGVTDLSMPRIGCGLDGLEWSKVELMLREIFADMDLTVTIYTL